VNLAELRPKGLVMVVDDEPRMRELLVTALSQWGFNVTSARSGEEALRMVEIAATEIVVLDLNLPGMDGLECLALLREKLPKLQAIVLTGFASVESARRAVHLDVVEFLTKPAPLGEIEKALDRAMRRLMPRQDSAGSSPAPQSPASDRQMTLQEVEREHILAALARAEGNRTAAAAALGISRRTLYYKLEEYEKQDKERENDEGGRRKAEG
jgi:two-component system response regulator RegA